MHFSGRCQTYDVEEHRYAYRIAIKPCWSSPDTIVCMDMHCSFGVFAATKVFVSHSMTTPIYVLNRSQAHELYLYGVSVTMASVMVSHSLPGLVGLG